MTMRLPDPFTCIHCGMTSYNPNDAVYRYCGNCHHYCDDVEPEAS